jgi:hypothetical protein
MIITQGGQWAAANSTCQLLLSLCGPCVADFAWLRASLGLLGPRIGIGSSARAVEAA